MLSSLCVTFLRSEAVLMQEHYSCILLCRVWTIWIGFVSCSVSVVCIRLLEGSHC